ncbi:MAG: hypothetical protein J1E97_03465 [Muribaculaceae bacterium]|nr:hypothetical protein [Muribaculaceae bacterium]
MERPVQETTSTYFNPILKKGVAPVSVENIDPGLIDTFNSAVEEAFTDDAPVVKERIKYLMPYIIQNIDWEEYGMPLEGWQLKYYYQRERFLKVSGLSYDKFLNHTLLLQAIEDLELEPEPVFEFILFLSYYYHLRCDLRYSSIELLEKLKTELKKGNAEAQMDVVLDGRHYKFSNSSFVKALISSVEIEALTGGSFKNDFNEGPHRDKVRALDYFLIKTLLDFLPIHKEGRRGRFSQAERNFSLCVLNFCGRLQGDEPEIICSQFNNATFDKLMRDFKDTEIPFAMELFL